MKSRWSLAPMFVLMGALVVQGAVHPIADLLPDPTFDGPHSPDQQLPTEPNPALNGWICTGWGGASYQDGTDAMTGTSYLRLFQWFPSYQAAAYCQSFMGTTLIAGETYEFRFYARGINSPMRLVASFLLMDWTTNVGEVTFPKSGLTDDWQLLTYRYTPSVDQQVARFTMTGYTDDAYGGLNIDPLPARVPVTVHGTADLEGFHGDKTTVGLKCQLTPTEGGAAASRTVLLDADGRFALDNITEGTYTLTVGGDCWLTTVREGVTVALGPSDIGSITLRGADANGDDQVNFGDFSLLQNAYGRRGGAATMVTPRTSAAHAVDGQLAAGEWATLYSDLVPDKPSNGCVELARWGAEVRDGILYGTFELDPAGPTVAEFDTYPTKQLWLGLWIDADPAADPVTGVANGDDQFAPPRAQDINIELGMDNGSLICQTTNWNSLNFWGRNNDFNNRVPVTVNAAYQGHVVEFAVPVDQIINEIALTDGATPGNVWKIGARAAGHVSGEDYAGDITDLQSVTVFGIEGRVVLQGYRGDNTTVGVKCVLTPAGGGDPITQTVLLDPDGVFILDPVPAGTYNLTIKSGSSLSAVLSNVSVETGVTDLGTIELANADINGDDQVSFEDFAILQNNYGDGGSSASPLAALAGGCGSLGITLLSSVGLAFFALRPRNG